MCKMMHLCVHACVLYVSRKTQLCTSYIAIHNSSLKLTVNSLELDLATILYIFFFYPIFFCWKLMNF